MESGMGPLSWVPVTTCHMGFIFKSAKLFSLLNSLTLTTSGTCLDALSLVTLREMVGPCGPVTHVTH